MMMAIFCMDFRMQIGRVTKILEDPPLVIVFYLRVELSRGQVKSKPQLPSLAQKVNISASLKLLQKQFGCNNFYKTLVFKKLSQPPFTLIVRML